VRLVLSGVLDGTVSPIQPTDKRRRVFRGGSWRYSSATFVRAAFRDGITPSFRGGSIGFRCAQRGARMPLKVTP
jgi:formylglycine-generating enzyme required for sulfatase activity